MYNETTLQRLMGSFIPCSISVWWATLCGASMVIKKLSSNLHQQLLLWLTRMSTLRTLSSQCFPVKEMEMHQQETTSFLLKLGLEIKLEGQINE